MPSNPALNAARYDAGLTLPDSLSTDWLCLTITPPSLRYSLRLKTADHAPARKLTGLKLPAKMLSSVMSDQLTLARLSVDEFFIIAAQGDKALPKALDKLSGKITHSLTDISHRNIGLELSGPGAAEAITTGCPLDLCARAFPIGRVTRTLFEDIPILLMRRSDDAFTIEVWRSFAPYMRDFLAKLAKDRHMEDEETRRALHGLK